MAAETKKVKIGFSLPARKIGLSQKIFLVQQLHIMVKAGVSLTGALQTLQAQSSSKHQQAVLGDVAKSVERGTTLAEALRPHTKDFGELMVNMVAAGETSGRLEEVLGQIYLQMKKDHEIVSRVRGALTYPAVVVVAMILIGMGMMIFIIPQLTQIFKESSVELPLPTRILIAVSDFMKTYALLVVPGVFVGFAGFLWGIHQPSIQPTWHRLVLGMPIVGTIVRKVNVARFARTVSSFLKTDIPIVQTLNTTANVLGNTQYRIALQTAAKLVTKGTPLSESLKAWPKLFNPTIVQMIAVGEQSGSLDDVLVEAAGFYEDEVAQTMTTLPSLLEPVLMLMLGVGVGGMAVAIILPLYRLTEAF